MAQISFEGRLTADAEIKYGNDGKPRAQFTVAENFRQLNRNTNEWEDSGVTFHNVTLFGRQAETAPLTKGQIVTVAGTEKSRAYTNQQGEQKQWTETTTNTVGIVPAPQRQQPQQAPQPQQYGHGTGGGDGWPPAAQPGQGLSAFQDNPPF